MKRQTAALLIFAVNLCAVSSSAQTDSAQLFGDAIVGNLDEIGDDLTLYCDILDFPPIVGQGMPVKIRGIDTEQSLVGPEIKAFVRNAFVTPPNEDPNQPPFCIRLKNIQRGTTFCLIADIQINGQDLGDMLVQEGLVNRILKVPTTTSADRQIPEMILTPAPSSSLANSSLQPAIVPAGGYVASKTSKIYHRPDCYHVKRISDDKKVNYPTKQQAEASGKRPCKTCNP